MAFKNLKLKTIQCFGYPTTWVKSAQHLNTLSWKSGIDKTKFEEELSKNIDDSYLNILSFVIEDLDTDIIYDIKFDNNKKLYIMTLSDSSTAEVLLPEKSAFFKSELFHKISSKALIYIQDATQTFTEFVQEHLDSGELLKINEVKLEAVLDFVNDYQLILNLKNGKYLK